MKQWCFSIEMFFLQGWRPAYIYLFGGIQWSGRYASADVSVLDQSDMMKICEEQSTHPRLKTHA
jgi:hypothetical protein